MILEILIMKIIFKSFSTYEYCHPCQSHLIQVTERDSVIKSINVFDDNIQTVLDGIQKEVNNADLIFLLVAKLIIRNFRFVILGSCLWQSFNFCVKISLLQEHLDIFCPSVYQPGYKRHKCKTIGTQTSRQLFEIES